MIISALKKDFSSVSEFVHFMNMEQEFKEKYDVGIDRWQHKISDVEVIMGLLEERDGQYLIDYDSLSDTISVYEILKKL